MFMVIPRPHAFEADPSHFDIVALYPHRWNHLWRRSHNLMSRFAEHRRVYYVQDPLIEGRRNFNEYIRHRGITAVVPHVKAETRNIAIEMRRLIHELFTKEAIVDYILWYGAPHQYAYTSHLFPEATIYDCTRVSSIDPDDSEQQLLARADLVFTKGASSFDCRRQSHNNIHVLPDGVDVPHFRAARDWPGDPPDQEEIPHPRVGYCGTLDSRIDFALLSGLAKSRPHWQFILLGPLANINPASLPQRSNVHYLGRKSYAELPEYMAGWDCSMLPYAVNDQTRNGNPGKVGEYLAAGKPVISTPLPDVVRTFGLTSLVQIADGHAAFANAINRVMSNKNRALWLSNVDAFLQQVSWENTWEIANTLTTR